jgi:hypothetical protein
MSTSALVMAVPGLAATFMPHEILGWLGVAPAPVLPLMVQILGALYLAFAMLNWMARGSLIGGIYNRPVALGNFLHFAVGALTLVKVLLAGHAEVAIWIASAIYALFAVWFGLVLFGSPVKAGAPVESPDPVN